MFSPLRFLRFVAVLGLVSVTAPGCRPRTAPDPAPEPITVIPTPVSLTRLGGPPFLLTDSSAIYVQGGDSARLVAEALALQLRPPTGFALELRDAPAGDLPRHGIRLRLDAAALSRVGPEGYELRVTSEGVDVAAPAPAGLFYGIQTLRQLFPWGIEAQNSVIKMGNWLLPAVAISDQPRFGWRGAMLDVSRHFFTVDEVKQYIDMLSLYKFNRFHLHLADDQGFRIEIKSRPVLTALGAATEVGGRAGGYYTQDEYVEIVRYAAERFLTLIPEIDMPGHTNALLLGHPELSCGRQAPAPYTSIRVGFSALCPEMEGTWALVDDIVREISALTPGPWFHIGGDEVETLNRERYAGFVERAQEVVTRHGKRMIGWEEIYKGRLLPTTLVQQWRSDSARNALVYGSKIILSPARKLYIDMKYSTATELGLRWAGIVTLRTTYDWDPAAYIAGVGEADIAGIEAPLWAETIRNITAAQYLAMPRLPSIAEVAWSPQGARRWDDFRRRLAAHAPRWRLLGINYFASPEVEWR